MNRNITEVCLEKEVYVTKSRPKSKTNILGKIYIKKVWNKLKSC